MGIYSVRGQDVARSVETLDVNRTRLHPPEGRAREQGRTAFPGLTHVNPSGPAHVSFHFGFL